MLQMWPNIINQTTDHYRPLKATLLKHSDIEIYIGTCVYIIGTVDGIKKNPLNLVFCEIINWLHLQIGMYLHYFILINLTKFHDPVIIIS